MAAEGIGGRSMNAEMRSATLGGGARKAPSRIGGRPV